LGRRFDEAMSADYLAINAHYRGMDDEGISIFLAAQKEFSALGEHDAEQMILQNIATISYQHGKYTTARNAFAELVPLLRDSGNKYLLSAALINFASVLSETGDQDSALRFSLEALDASKQAKNAANEARALGMVGVIYDRLGDTDRAIQFLSEAVRIGRGFGTPSSKSGPQRRQAFHFLIRLGNSYRRAKHTDNALAIHNEALQFAASAFNRAEAKSAIGTDLVVLGRAKDAVSLYNEALADVGAGDRLKAEILISSARADRELRDDDSWRSHLLFAKDAARASGSLVDEAEVAIELARLYESNSKNRTALHFTDEALNLYERMTLRTYSPELAAASASTRRSAVYLKIELLTKIAAVSKSVAAAKQVIARALLAADKFHADSLTGHFGNQLINDSEEDLLDEIIGKQAVLEKLLDRDTLDETEIQRVTGEIALLRSKFDSESLPHTRNTPNPTEHRFSIEALEKFQVSIPENCAVVEYFLGEKSGWAWILNRRSVRILELQDVGRILSSVAATTRLLSTPPSGTADDEQLNKLVELLLPHVVRADNLSCLAVIPDQSLYEVPFAALFAKNTNSSPVSVVLAPSVEDIYRRASSNRLIEPQSRIVIFSEQTPAKLGVQHAPLLGATTEVAAIRKLYGTDSVYVANGPEVSRQGFLGFDFSKFDVVHIVGHGIADVGDNRMSRILLGPINDINSAVLANDVARLNFESKLVVLSGCKTAIGTETSNSKSLGLAYQFLTSGAASVVASYWNVPDAATAYFVEEFYRQLAVLGTTVSGAIAHTQETMRRSKRYSRAFYWAGWTAISTELNGT